MPGLPRERRIHATSIHAALVAAATTDCHSRTGMLVSRWITNAADSDENGPAKLTGLAQHIYDLLQGEDKRLAQYTVAAVRYTALFWGGGEKALQTHYERPEAERIEIRNTIRRIMHAEYETENGAKPTAWYFALEPVPPPAMPFAAPFGNGPDQRFPWLPSTYANCFQRCGEFFVDPANPERLGFRRDQGFPLEWFQADNSLVYITEIQNLLSNSKVRNVIHSGRITFRVLTNYIPHLRELQSAVTANYNPRSQAWPTP